MKLGSGIALAALGAILAFAIPDAIEGIDLQLIGYIVMAAGIIGVILALILSRPRESKTVTASKTDVDPQTGTGTTRSERVDQGEPLV